VWLASEDVEGTFNKRNHGLSRDELTSVLNHLFRRGELLAQRVRTSEPKVFFKPTEAEIQEALDGRLDVTYGLTPQGGARWEEVSRPHWERYISAWVYADPQEGQIVGSDRGLVEKYNSMSHYVWDISVVPGSKRWDVLEPWQATYWKQLLLGHRVRFSFEWIERLPDSKIEPAISERLAEIHNWYTPYTPDLKTELDQN
jgi:hypothetical protein